MPYAAQLRFLQAAFRKCHIRTQVLDPYNSNSVLPVPVNGITPQTVYKLSDPLHCSYLLLLLSEQPAAALLIGPYVSKEPSKQQILEWAETAGMAVASAKELEKYYSDVPVIPDSGQLLAVVDAFAELLWENSDYAVVDIDNEPAGDLSPLPQKGPAEPEAVLRDMQRIEMRYAYENEMMQAVTQGQTHKVDRYLSAFSTMPFEKRLADPVRNLKNYCIIMNTLLRKAAEKGGVHPIHLDSVSSDFARRIELANTVEMVHTLMADMFRSYCRLVRKHSMKHYSPPVQKAITCIDADLTANLKLSALAAVQNVSPAYLSALFRQETGQTLTAFVNEKRVKMAKQLLETTRLQIQTVAQHCGMPDVQYFSKIFKKHAGLTPREYREMTAHT